MEGHSLRSRHRSMEYEIVYIYTHESNLDEIETYTKCIQNNISL